MLLDLNVDEFSESAAAEYDVCIIGAGAAGVTLALELDKAGKRVALCEAGGQQYSVDSQDYYKGKVTGDPYFPLDAARLRFLGGTTNHWAGYCRTFEPVDFERSKFGEHYAWPIKHDDISPYLAPACDILEIGSDFKTNEQAKTAEVRKIEFKISPPVRFGQKYLEDLKASKNIQLYLNANLLDLAGKDGQVTTAKLANYDKKSMTVKAKQFVFAMGGIENSRYLLWLAEQHGDALFNSKAPIGQYWMEHPHFDVGRALVGNAVSDNRFYATTAKAQTNRNILGCGFYLEKTGYEGTKKMVNDLLCVAPSLSKQVLALANKDLLCGVTFKGAWEQSPQAHNKVTLSSTEKDAFGIPRVDLKWRKNELDRNTITESVSAFNQWLLRDDLGRIQLDDWMLNGDEYPEDAELAGYHHIGGTRMSETAQYGVVDKNCKVFGSKNLYIAGSSIFTTGGFNNPTLPIVQFALRLKDHLVKLS